jgi:hypothetical protein
MEAHEKRRCSMGVYPCAALALIKAEQGSADARLRASMGMQELEEMEVKVEREPS